MFSLNTAQLGPHLPSGKPQTDQALQNNGHYRQIPDMPELKPVLSNQPDGRQHERQQAAHGTEQGRHGIAQRLK